MEQSLDKRDLVIIGGGAGGLVVASVAAQLGLKTTLIEKHSQLGGDCLHFGCVPSKALLRCAHVAGLLRKAAEFGFQAVTPETDLGRVNAFIQSAVDKIQHHDSHERFRELGCEVLRGVARFADAHSIMLGETLIQSKRFVIATGSRTWIPPIDGVENIDYLTNEDMYSLEALPQRLLVLGGGPVGVEMAQAYARLGSKVTLVELEQRILPRSDPEISAVLSRQLKIDGVEIVHGEVVRLSSDAGSITAEFRNRDQIVADKLLIAIGRRAVVNDLGLERAGVEYSERGISVNAKMQTSQRNIYACGDVTGLLPFTHVAEQQAGIVIANAVFRLPKRIDYRVIPSVVFTEPECAQVGVDADEHDSSLRVIKFDMKDLDRAVAENETTGFVKLVIRKGRLVGAHVIGQHAGELIHELALAIQQKLKLSKVSTLVHAYPSWSQVNRRAASQYFRDSLFSPKTKRLVKFINKWLP
jgi:pyruvate/2-oxoglutarate dehydrogenase complex dihydrolipoamide dehydrogenase (E3) component